MSNRYSQMESIKIMLRNRTERLLRCDAYSGKTLRLEVASLTGRLHALRRRGSEYGQRHKRRSLTA